MAFAQIAARRNRFRCLGKALPALADEITGRKRDRIFSYTPYVALFRDQPPAADEGEVQETEADLG